MLFQLIFVNMERHSGVPLTGTQSSLSFAGPQASPLVVEVYKEISLGHINSHIGTVLGVVADTGDQWWSRLRAAGLSSVVYRPAARASASASATSPTWIAP